MTVLTERFARAVDCARIDHLAVRNGTGIPHIMAPLSSAGQLVRATTGLRKRPMQDKLT
jgi:hypothetical protein